MSGLLSSSPWNADTNADPNSIGRTFAMIRFPASSDLSPSLRRQRFKISTAGVHVVFRLGRFIAGRKLCEQVIPILSYATSGPSKNGFTLIDFLDDSVDAGSPHEGRRVGVVLDQVVVNGGDQIRHATEDATAEALPRQLAEPAFDEIEPRGARRREMQREAGMRAEPLSDGRMLVGPVIVQDDVQRDLARKRAVEAPQELENS